MKEDAARAPILVVGTGRCGSTMLAEILGFHADLLTLSEFASSSFPAPLPFGDDGAMLDGKQFADVYAAPRAEASFLYRHGLEPSEFDYPIDHTVARYTRRTGVPPLLVTTLSRLVEDATQLDDAFDAFLADAARRSSTTYVQHLRQLADSMTSAFGGRRTVEQSGGSLLYYEWIRTIFPDALVIHIVRDGRDCALSLHGHPSFRLAHLQGQLALQLGHDPLRWVPECPEELEDGFAALYGPLTPDSFATQGPDLAWFARSWSSLVMTAKDRVGVSASDVLHVSYERIVEHATDELTRLAEFVGVNADPEWLAAGTALVKHGRNGRWLDLEERQRRQLELFCRPGNRAAKELLT